MTSECECVQDLDDVLFVIRVCLAQCRQQVSLDGTLCMKSLLVLKNFDSDELVGLVVEALVNLAKRTSADEFLDLVAVGYVVLRCTDVFLVLVIETKIVRLCGIG